VEAEVVETVAVAAVMETEEIEISVENAVMEKVKTPANEEVNAKRMISFS